MVSPSITTLRGWCSPWRRSVGGARSSSRVDRPSRSAAASADLVLFSGDKLLGGPQAGVIVGRADLIGRLRKHPLMRAVRPDKITIAALGATLLHYVRGEAAREIPVWRMIGAQPPEIEARARAWRVQLPAVEGALASVEPGESTIGGGSLP